MKWFERLKRAYNIRYNTHWHSTNETRDVVGRLANGYIQEDIYHKEVDLNNEGHYRWVYHSSTVFYRPEKNAS